MNNTQVKLDFTAKGGTTVMDHYPKMSELPSFISSPKWTWHKEDFGYISYWIGIDESGREWLVKMQGSSHGFREWCFDRVS